MKIKFFLFGLACFAATPGAVANKTLATLQVNIGEPNQLYIPVSVALDSFGGKQKRQFSLVEVNGTQKTPVPFQIYGKEQAALYWLVPAGEHSTRTYQLITDAVPEDAGQVAMMNLKSEDGVLTISADDRHLLAYQFGFMPAPDGVDPAFGRSGFIHPLWSPKGQVLTRIQPPDHYHHYGIWNPWTHLSYEGREADLWNLGDKKGTVRFKEFVSRAQGPVFAEYKARHQHILYGEKRTEKNILNEIQSVRVYRPAAQDYYLMDMVIELTPATDSPVTLLEYRYGGFGWRATGQWDRTNSEMLSSEGKTRADIDNTKGRWFLVQGKVGGDYAGAEVMSHPDNFNHPEPMRMWGIPEDPQDRGDVFASFSPTRDRDWLLEPGKTYTRRYRFVVYNGRLEAQKAENGWQLFASPPVVKSQNVVQK